MSNENPCDWDGDTYCVECIRPATHKKVFAMIADSPIYEFVCCQCAVSIEKEKTNGNEKG